MWLSFKTVLVRSHSSPPVFLPQGRTSLSAALRYKAWTEGGSNPFGFPTVFQVPAHLGPYFLTQNRRKVQWPSSREELTGLYLTVGSKLLPTRWSQRMQKICERLQERRQWRSHTYQLYKGKSTITVSNKKHVLCSWLGNKMVPNINCMFFRRSIILQKEIMFATITF